MSKGGGACLYLACHRGVLGPLERSSESSDCVKGVRSISYAVSESTPRPQYNAPLVLAWLFGKSHALCCAQDRSRASRVRAFHVPSASPYANTAFGLCGSLFYIAPTQPGRPRRWCSGTSFLNRSREQKRAGRRCHARGPAGRRFARAPCTQQPPSHMSTGIVHPQHRPCPTKRTRSANSECPECARPVECVYWRAYSLGVTRWYSWVVTSDSGFQKQTAQLASGLNERANLRCKTNALRSG